MTFSLIEDLACAALLPAAAWVYTAWQFQRCRLMVGFYSARAAQSDAALTESQSYCFHLEARLAEALASAANAEKAKPLSYAIGQNMLSSRSAGAALNLEIVNYTAGDDDFRLS